MYNDINRDLLTGNINGWYDVTDFNSGSFQIEGSAGISAGAIFFEQTNDETSTVGLPLRVLEVTAVNTIPQVAAFNVTASSRRLFKAQLDSKFVRVRISTAFVGGTVRAVSFFSTDTTAMLSQTINQSSQANLLATVYQALGTAATRWFAQLSDGTNSPSIKAASTASLATDPSLVVNVSPNMAVTTHNLNSAATTNLTSVKASAGTIFSITASNINASARFLKIYNKASAPVTASDIPFLTIPLPANSVQNIEFGAFGIRLATGIALAITGLAVDNDATAVAVGDVKTAISYN